MVPIHLSDLKFTQLKKLKITTTEATHCQTSSHLKQLKKQDEKRTGKKKKIQLSPRVMVITMDDVKWKTGRVVEDSIHTRCYI